MIKHNWKITVIAFAFLPVIISSQALGAARNHEKSLKFGLQAGACTAIAPPKFDLDSVRASVEGLPFQPQWVINSSQRQSTIPTTTGVLIGDGPNPTEP
jgi:hypothetical protein